MEFQVMELNILITIWNLLIDKKYEKEHFRKVLDMLFVEKYSNYLANKKSLNVSTNAYCTLWYFRQLSISS